MNIGPVNKWVAIGLASLGLAAFSVQDQSWLAAGILTALGVLNLVIGFRHSRSNSTDSATDTAEPEEKESRTPEWVRNVATGLIMFAVMSLLLLILFGDPVVAIVMAAFVMAPITLFGAVTAFRRGRKEGAARGPVGGAQPPP
jgi:phosphatidylglycerophosphate synthase